MSKNKTAAPTRYTYFDKYSQRTVELRPKKTRLSFPSSRIDAAVLGDE